MSTNCGARPSRRRVVLGLGGCAGLLVARPGLAGAREPFAFSGRVARGQSYERKVAEGLWFQLQPDINGWGWRIWLGDPDRPHDSYARVVTPPFRGVNHLDLYGWHFRNSDNSGPNTIGPKNVNAPQRRRAFRFVETWSVYKEAEQILPRMLWPKDEAQFEVAQQAFHALPVADGRLEITELVLGNLVIGEPAWIESLAFEVTLFTEPL